MRPVILCGGSGSRLWPLSKPKQFQKIFSQNTMFQNTLLRLKSDYMLPIIATNIQYESLVMEELHALQEYKVIFEPVKIGTAAAILIAALLCDKNETILILPSDHFIGDLNSFYVSIEKASKLASETDSIVTFGVKPHEFNSEYGYINAVYDQKRKYHIVKSFIEKPEYELDNDHYWNSGMFVLKARRYIDEIKKIALHLYNLCCASIKHFVPRERFLYLKQQDCAGIEGISIDHLVIEKAENVVMIEANFDWMDVGTWGSVLELSKRFSKNLESFQPIIKGREPVLMTENDAKNLLSRVYKRPNKSLMLFINKVKEAKPIRKEIKPWGFYSIVLMGTDFLIKYLFINPLSCTSKQFHHYRDEYHIILSGVGCVSLDDKTYAIAKNHVIEIPRKVLHRIENKSTSFPLEIVEFQVGKFLSDSDIVRLDDVYGRF
ncbi:mannose-1-phosphate guanylyltransferase [Wolbachia endosymbiont of Armadillidium vulgare str. wVulC]|uniref:sugar phosphate nucleotidyltransferase n=1 Tax=Wolbachia endosymbiont of Armadillidium vulgare TaxID=77039 RepID=UPI00064B5757|nr:sugar phosphate nucleotidyltransferase [Wolbachia endosymbiont of Armadillidium vulgare]KLT22263.1 mannose-1-phosphate guanylyltransferase [Wolbachia endosymbiont of Armadillidium vulgare str. wVulC]OJH30435.1 Alginate biosynthesis protein AlgA [Armadillidium vulgare] [Wolbachia endosymbiont of Armadillidium vulgare]OJH32165.1 Alginate biosynthesis protein AlgA [Wolbachia endosymbiont of Armadillidium vulgare]OJH33038.1 Alginate biosynthesis protein AlgA [Wolbachia endosymbiont of Armadillid